MSAIPVLIAGGGPVGMTLALELARRGIRSMVVERNESTTTHPKMDITNGRSMELFRRLGLIDELRAVAVAPDHPFDVSWITSFAGHELHRFRYATVDEGYANILRNNDGSQSLEPPMRVSQVEIEPVLKRAIERNPFIDARFGVQFEALAQDADGVTVTLRRPADGGSFEVRCRYLVGCDGGGSRVRRALEIGLSGTPNVMQRFMTHFKSDAREVLQRWGFAWHYQSVHGTLIAQNDKDVWTLHTRFPDGAGESPDPSALIRRFVGVDIPHQVLVSNAWVPHLVVADSYGHGRVILAGDSAHQYIPTGGYGMNTGIGDACDAAWKLAAVIHGFGGTGLIDAYETERRPVGLRNCAGSRRHNDVRVKIGGLYANPLEAPGAQGEHARADVSTQIAALGNAENESFGLELGYIYGDSPLVTRESGIEIPDSTLHYIPTTVPGARLPSVYLNNGTPLYDQLGDWFTLLSFSGNADACGYFVEAARRRGIPLTVVQLDEPSLRSIYDAPLILVRPDQHVAWRGSDVFDSARASRVLEQALGWSSVIQAPLAARPTLA